MEITKLRSREIAPTKLPVAEVWLPHMLDVSISDCGSSADASMCRSRDQSRRLQELHLRRQQGAFGYTEQNEGKGAAEP